MHLLEWLEARRLLSSAGDIDPSFGTNGIVPLPQLENLGLHSLIIAAGNDRFLIFMTSGLEEVDSNGSPVAAFGQGGILDRGADPEGALVQPDGKILLWEFPLNGTAGHGELTRLNADGSVDTAFGDQGVVDDKSVLNSQQIQSVVLQSDGKIVVLSDSLSELSVEFVRRLNTDGTLDTTFHDFTLSSASVLGFVCQSTDKLLLGSELSIDQPQGGITRLNADGTQDLTFGSGGMISAQESGFTDDIALIPGGADAFVAVDSLGTVRKFSADGVHDTSFHSADGNGVAETDIFYQGGTPVHILPAPGGKWLIYNEFGMTRLNSDGSRDQSFGRLATNGASPEFDGAVFDSHGDILFTSGLSHARALFRLFGAAEGNTPSPIVLANSTLTITGTEGDDDITVGTAQVSSSADPPPQAIVVAIHDQPERLFDVADVQHVTVLAQGGNDRVQIGIDVAASVSGGDGNDTLSGGDGNDSLSGNAGRDLLLGGLGNDRVAGNGGNDKIGGGPGDDILIGGAGNDSMAGESGNDLLEGGSGNDVLYGSPDGIDTFAGGAGDDRFFAQDGNAESIFGDAGNDTASADASDILNGVENVSQP